ncbi:CARDB domain-containing protein [Dactylosporangium sp. CA-233914]|uniref:CARDB domain-containing protein n=1 Tax=Dactylosporangium sp. CA-233914 TaxID=3239934 RepID=UPI003D8B039A
MRQWRGYRWTGSALAQDAGPTSFKTSSHGVTLNSVALRLQPDSGNGTRTALLTLTVRNGGSAAVRDVTVVVYIDGDTMAQAGDCPAVAEDWFRVNQCTAGTLAPGASKTFTLRYTIPAYMAAELTVPTVTPAGYVFLNLGDQHAAQADLPRATT